MAFQGADHHHGVCADSARRAFEQKARTSGTKPGANVREVLDILLNEHRAYGAYEIADQMSLKGKNLRPVQIYRALDALVELGCVHRIETANAYVACHGGTGCRKPQLMICQSCSQVAEINSEMIEDSIAQTVKTSRFVLQSSHIELFGFCPDCSH